MYLLLRKGLRAEGFVVQDGGGQLLGTNTAYEGFFPVYCIGYACCSQSKCVDILGRVDFVLFRLWPCQEFSIER